MQVVVLTEQPLLQDNSHSPPNARDLSFESLYNNLLKVHVGHFFQDVCQYTGAFGLSSVAHYYQRPCPEK
jgi:hypothetical protein